MHPISKRLIHWLNILLIVTLLGSLLPPAPRALAASLTNDPIEQEPAHPSVKTSKPVMSPARVHIQEPPCTNMIFDWSSSSGTLVY
jgi:hypothetical protein